MGGEREGAGRGRELLVGDLYIGGWCWRGVWNDYVYLYLHTKKVEVVVTHLI